MKGCLLLARNIPGIMSVFNNACGYFKLLMYLYDDYHVVCAVVSTVHAPTAGRDETRIRNQIRIIRVYIVQ